MAFDADDVFKVVSERLPEAGIDVLMIGGHAVNYYGFVRATQDIDFMVTDSDEQILRDIAHLVLEHGLDVEKVLKPLCEEFGSEDIYKTIRERMERLKPD